MNFLKRLFLLEEKRLRDTFDFLQQNRKFNFGFRQNRHFFVNLTALIFHLVEFIFFELKNWCHISVWPQKKLGMGDADYDFLFKGKLIRYSLFAL